MADVQVRNLALRYGTMKALDNVSLDFPDGQFFGLLGPSGSGKTTLLRTIAGFIYPQEGTVRIGGEPVEAVPVEKREIGMMFQNYALFPNMSVRENVGFGLRVRHVEGNEFKRRTDEILELVHLTGLEDRRPHQLSGGQKQRVALARAIVTRPRVLLLDEPLSALDKALRIDMQIELKRIQREVGITTIFVTHDQEEALTLSDRIGILRDGRLVQEGPPRAVYDAPADLFTAGFLGEVNNFQGKCERRGLRLPDDTVIAWPAGQPTPVRNTILAVRPEFVSLCLKKPKEDNLITLRVFLEQIIFSGPTATCLVRHGEQRLKAFVRTQDLAGMPSSGDMWISWPANRMMVFPAEQDASIDQSGYQ